MPTSLLTKIVSVVAICFCLIFVANCQLKRIQIQPSLKPLNIAKQVTSLNEFKEQFTIIPGKVTLLYFPYFGPFKVESLMCNGNKIPFFAYEDRPQAFAYLAPSYFEIRKEFSCEFHFGTSEISNTDINIVSIGQFNIGQFKYLEERLHVDKTKITLSPNDTKRVEDEKLMLNNIFLNSEKKLLISEPFSSPLDSQISSAYGTKRIFNKSLDTQHLGIDFRAKIGTKIHATNTGTVVFAGDLFFGGNTVVVDHGLGIFTSYSHLSKITVKVGDQVKKESTLGLSGMTGRVNGPHLHWGVKVHGNWMDGLSLIKASKNHFHDDELIISKEANTADKPGLSP